VKPKTEIFLYFLLWSAQSLTRPTFRNLDESFEAWAYRNGLLHHLAVLERQGWIESKAGHKDDRVYRLTEAGRCHALGGRDPEAGWSRPWDGLWRLVAFDLPKREQAQRAALRRYLRRHGFGYLQNSIWITPEPLEQQAKLLRGGKIDVESLILMEARPCAGESDHDLVAGAWDFDQINALYREHLAILKQKPNGPLTDAPRSRSLYRWATREHHAWAAITNADPFLPERILPAGYLGRKIWRMRQRVLSQAARQLRTFKV
jgi:phenylacetic acid degradation operon negative regulatory protein